MKTLLNEIVISITIQFIAFCNNKHFSNANPLIGENVRAAGDNEFPFVVSLGHFRTSTRDKKYKNHFCGGSLISKKHVLTAEHCIKNKKVTDNVVTHGDVDLNKGKQYTVKSWITYNEWAKKKHIVKQKFRSNDIAIVTLSREIDGITPVVRSNLTDGELYGKRVITAGWGLMADGRLTQFLQKASLRVLTVAQCRRHMSKLFERLNNVPNDVFCTHNSPTVVLGCGDSGGPLILADTKEIVGVNNAVICDVKDIVDNPYATSLHVKVHYFKDFIDDALKH